MRILLVHNPKAGDGNHGADEIAEVLQKAGHEVRHQSTKKKGFKKALSKSIDLVVVAGGDGAVGKVAQQLIGGSIPLSVLPLGTANNLARMLGFTSSTDKLVARLAMGQRRSFDVGMSRGPWGKRYFFEGAGAGLLADYFEQPREVAQEEDKISRAEEMRRHVVELRRQLQDYRARRWKIELDGKDFSGRYLLWQVMNIRSVGPVLRLAPKARTDDGYLDFVGAREQDRASLLAYLDARLAGTKRTLPLKVTRFKRMQFSWKKVPLHFDDQIWPDENQKPGGRDITIAAKPAALQIWS